VKDERARDEGCKSKMRGEEGCDRQRKRKGEGKGLRRKD